jgi:AcrR family transcriptional regulator
MKSYTSSENTKNKLILVAGELFAEHGVKAVTTRMIADSTKENIGTIHYHFGGKDGLLAAVVDFCVEKWKNRPYDRILDEHKELLSSREGIAEIVKKFIDKHVEIAFAPGKPSWRATFIFQLIQRESDISNDILKEFVEPQTYAFIRLYQTVFPEASFEDGHIWELAVIAPFVLLAVNRLPISRLNGTEDISSDFILETKKVVTRNALSSLGLSEYL